MGIPGGIQMNYLSKLIVLTALFMGLLCQAAVVLADIPRTINYQGRLTDPGGNPVVDAQYLIQFRFYDAESGGTTLWDSGFRGVDVSDGLFAYQLGDSTAIPGDLFAGNVDVWLGVKVSTDPEISPRTKIDASAFAFHALSADTADNVSNGVGISQYIDVSYTAMMNSFTVLIATDSILAPADGFVICQVTCNVSCLHTGGTNGGLNLEFREGGGPHLTDQEFFWVLPTVLPTDAYEIPATIHRVFKAVPGYNKFEFLGVDFLDAGNSYGVSRVVMTLTYVPAAYGTVNLTSVIKPDEPKTIQLDDKQRQGMIERALPSNK